MSAALPLARAYVSGDHDLGALLLQLFPSGNTSSRPYGGDILVHKLVDGEGRRQSIYVRDVGDSFLLHLGFRYNLSTSSKDGGPDVLRALLGRTGGHLQPSPDAPWEVVPVKGKTTAEILAHFHDNPLPPLTD